MKAQPAVIPEIVSQFADNCASLWLIRENAARARAYPSTLADLDRLDARVDAQIDGLRMSGDYGWCMAAQGLELQGAGEIFTAAALAFEDASATRADGDKVEALFRSIEKPISAIRALAVALDWIDRARFPIALERLSTEEGELAEAVVLSALAMRAIAPLERAAAALETGSKFLVRAACEAAISAGMPALIGPIEAHLAAEDVETAANAAIAALILGSRRAIEVVKRVAVEPKQSRAESAATALFRSLQPVDALAMHRELFGANKATRAAVRAAGAAGIRELTPFLIETLDSAPLARLAGEAFCEIAGVDVEDEGLARKTDENAGGGPTEDPDDENTDLDPDEGKPWPDQTAVELWWREHSLEFEPLTRYMAGTIVNEESLKRSLSGGPQKVRAAAAQLLALRGAPLFDVRAPAFRQAQRLAKEDLWR